MYQLVGQFATHVLGGVKGVFLTMKCTPSICKERLVHVMSVNV